MQYRALFVGLTTIDIQYFVDSFPPSNVKVKTNPPEIYVGGPASNAAVAFAKLNGGANLASASGKNAFSSFVEDDFISANIIHFDLAKTQKISPVIASVITSENNGDRNIFTHNPELKFTNYNALELFELIKPELLLLDGFYPEFALECARLAKEMGILTVIDCGSWKPHLSELLGFVDIAICSNDFYPPNCLTSSQVFDYFETKNVREIAISRGGENIIISNGEFIPVKSVNVVDTLGAGDFLHGAFCFFYLQSRNFSRALRKASELATNSCRYKGTRKWLNF